jgi:hypothetical protein
VFIPQTPKSSKSTQTLRIQSKMQHDEKVVAESTAKSSNGSDHGIANFEVAHTKQTYTTKMDLRLIPILGCTYTILFLDRTNSEYQVLLPFCTGPTLTCPSRQCQDRGHGEGFEYAKDWLQHGVVDLLHPFRLGRGPE